MVEQKLAELALVALVLHCEHGRFLLVPHFGWHLMVVDLSHAQDLLKKRFFFVQFFHLEHVEVGPPLLESADRFQRVGLFSEHEFLH